MTHPRAFKVDRREQGVDWKPWNLSYHSTEAAALAAAEGFLTGDGRFALSPSAPGTNRSAVVAKRLGDGRFPRWERVARLVKVNGEVVTFGPLQEVTR